MCEQQVDTATKKAKELGAVISRVVRVPGTFDMPIIIQRLLRDEGVDAVVLLGVVEKGETDHDKICMETTARLAQELALRFDKPVTNGVVWAKLELVPPRLDDYAFRAVSAAVRLCELLGTEKARV
jgi:6,7-dimethyl-8-ribityllumazine synthase